MYCLIQFYVQVNKDMTQYKPFLKITAIKLVIFLSFWQTVRSLHALINCSTNASFRL